MRWPLLARLLVVACVLSFFAGCTAQLVRSTAPVTLVGEYGFEFNLFRLHQTEVGATGANVEPTGLVRSGEPFELPAGVYYVANLCSQYRFSHDGKNPTEIPLGHFEVRFGARRAGSHDDQTLVECISQLTQQVSTWTNRSDFLVLPGETTFLIGKRPFKVFSAAGTANPAAVDLAPVIVFADKFPPKKTQTYSITPEATDSQQSVEVLTGEVGRRTWLLPGSYQLEVNGSQRSVTVESGLQTEVLVGLLRIETPLQLESIPTGYGREAFFVFMGMGVLLNLDTDYYLFPGEYKMNIQGSNLEKSVTILPNEKSVVTTRVARVDLPPCPLPEGDCGTPPTLTIHREQQPFPLMSVEPGSLFLVFDEEYEYGVAGLRGVLRRLPGTPNKFTTETLGVVNLKWELKKPKDRHVSGRVRTDLVRFEGVGTANFGKSLDLLFSKPSFLYAPPGTYHLSYFVGDPSQERKKTKIPFTTKSGGTQDLVIPLYAERSSKNKQNLAISPRSEKGKARETLPTKLNPIRR